MSTKAKALLGVCAANSLCSSKSSFERFMRAGDCSCTGSLSLACDKVTTGNICLCARIFLKLKKIYILKRERRKPFIAVLILK